MTEITIIPLKEWTKEKELEYIISLLPQFEYNFSKLARALKIDRKTLYNKLGQGKYKMYKKMAESTTEQ